VLGGISKLVVVEPMEQTKISTEPIIKNWASVENHYSKENISDQDKEVFEKNEEEPKDDKETSITEHKEAENHLKENDDNNEVQEEDKIDQERVFKDKLRQDYCSYHEVKWKVIEEEKSFNQKGLVSKGNDEVEEEYEYEEAEEEQDYSRDENEETNENDFTHEDDSEDEEEIDETKNNNEANLERIQNMDQDVLTKKLEKCIKKREKIQDLIKKITSNSYIKTIGDTTFAEIVNFFKLKLEVKS